ncbi:MAG: hemolysin family protein [Candidatus Omnitrophota bacterium]|nr:hemolysin family protein [Candidatus Omnitrophota bacterium]MBU1894319.1 hemolysin family protein [Candidatus Omnitrophota bacterium]
MDIIIFILLLAASAFFSSSETAFLSIDRIRLKQIEEMNQPVSKRVMSLLANPHKLLVTILIGNTLVNVAASAVLTDYFYRGMGEKGVGFSIVIITMVVLVFGEVTPKMFALYYRDQISFFASNPIKVLEKVFTPIRVVLSFITNMICNGFGVKVVVEKPKITEQEIKSLFLMGKKKGIVKEKETDMVYNILEFKELNAADIMSPRIDIVALDLTMERDDLVSVVKENQYSRFPAYIHTLDNIVGVIHSKDFLIDVSVPVRDLVRKPFFAPESMMIDDLLQELQKQNTHMAVVTDEYGVTSGIVTIEDILEEIVGEIRDELDYEKPRIRKIDQNKYEVDGQTHIDAVNDQIGMNIDTDEVDTIGGYMILLGGKIPQSGDSTEINGFILTVNYVSKNRITTLTIERKK